MKLVIKKPKENILILMRRLGYHFERQKEDQWVFARALGAGDYPKFHLYSRQSNEKLELNLHLDQKAPSYRGSAMHSGEYRGELVEKEAERIKAAINEQRTMNNEQ